MLTKGLELMPGNPDLLNLLGNLLVAQGDAEGAFAVAQELANQFPEDLAAQGNFARMLAATGRRSEALGSPEQNLNQAIEALEEARRRDPSRIEPLLNLAVVYGRKGTKDKAKALATEVLQRAPASARELREQAERLIKTLG